jgi:hypothetical protein
MSLEMTFCMLRQTPPPNPAARDAQPTSVDVEVVYPDNRSEPKRPRCSTLQPPFTAPATLIADLQAFQSG